jgi:hypothetical protein
MRAHVRRYADRPAGLRVYRTPESPSLGQEPAVAFAADLGESFKRQSSRFTDPGTQHYFVAERGGPFVVYLVSQHHPTDDLLRFRAGNSPPVSSRNVLDPSQVNSVVYVILLVDITGQHRNDHFETRGRHRKIQDKLEMRNQTGWTTNQLM